MTSVQTLKVRLYNSVTEHQHVVVADLPIDGKSYNALKAFGGNNPKYPGKLVGNTISINDFKGATFTLTSESGHNILVCHPDQAGLNKRFSGKAQLLGAYDDQEYDLSNCTISAKKGI